ncbi:hypothetical protein GPUN_0002 [Glaciecola punicea ACAM 611]|uniref:Uncharacterized protein n=1 Tax=Glaciecola punicea ACAM 611 TaxID=1121923 RepID=H5T779_9ALTE|nr:hypothetical protein GPUN_0002 [Glaciecola punicea ACAM 611]
MKSALLVVSGFLTSIILNRFFDFSFVTEVVIVCVVAASIYFIDKRVVKKKT